MADLKKLKPNKTNCETCAKDFPEKFSPENLYTICIRFISANLHLVESLQFFPDVVGIEIFEKAVQLGQFQDDSKHSLRKLQLFSEAYEDQLLNSLHVSGNHLCLNNYYDHFSIFLHVSHVDISSNGLGDDHEILHHLSRLKSLKTLSLRENHLTNKGVQKLTSPLRMLKHGGEKLLNLDLSENQDVTARCIKYLNCYKRLEVLNVSYTSVKLNPDQSKTYEYLLDWKDIRTDSSQMGEYMDRFTVTTEGWAKPVIKSWEVSSKTSARKKPAEKYKKGFHLYMKEKENTEMDKKKGGVLMLVKTLKAEQSNLIQKHTNERSNIHDSLQNTLSKTKRSELSKVKKDPEVEKKSCDIDDELMNNLYGSVPVSSKSVALSTLMDSW